MTNIYMVELLKEKFIIKKIENEIPKNCLERAQKYKLEEDYVRSLIGWNLLYKSLKDDYDINLELYNIFENEYKKPYIKADVYFNITHSNNFVCVIISKTPCGIDVECVRDIKNKDLFIKKIFSKNEKNLNLSNELLIEKWTQKEAYFKKCGTGIIYNYLNDEVKNVKTKELKDTMNNKYFLSYCSDDDIIKVYYR